MSKITRMGIDLGKNRFHVCAMDRTGRVVMQKQFTRRGLEKFIGAHERCVVGMEACGGAHHWARRLRALGYDARLMSAQFVKAYVKSNKNDWRDAEAICEAVGRPTMRFVPVKTVEQQSVQHLHRARSLAVSQRTALANQMRGFLFEYGLVFGQGIGTLRRRVVELVEDAENGLPMAMRELLTHEREELVRVDERVKRFDVQLDAFARDNEACRRLQTIPGVGPKVASALVAAAGDAKEFGSAREFAAWLGLTPRQRSTGGRTVLGGITKRGDRYLRSLLIHGARSALRAAANREDRRSRWAVSVHARRGANIAAVALANKNARIAWALLRREHDYHVTQPTHEAAAA